MTTLTRQHCLDLDQTDSLAPLRQQFSLPQGVIYLDGNSLGAMPKAALSRAQQVIQAEWGNDLIKSWNTAGWFELPSRLGNLLAPLIGADEGEVVVTDSTSINLFKALAAALQMQAANPATAARKVIITERSNFPTDIYMAEGLTRWLDRGYRLHLVDSPEELDSAINSDTALVMLTHVNYRSGALHDMAAITAHAHSQGALILWDLAHSAGAVPVELNLAKADFAVGCTYKYGNGGPGAPGWLYVNKKIQKEVRVPIQGWFAQGDQFGMGPLFERAEGIRGFQIATPPVIGLRAVQTSFGMIEKATIQAIEAKAALGTELMIDLFEEWLKDLGFALGTPRIASHRGGHISLLHEDAFQISVAMRKISKVFPDFRNPNVIRVAISPLTTSFVEIWDGFDRIRKLVASGEYRKIVINNARVL